MPDVSDADRKAAADWMTERMALVMAGETGGGELSLIKAFERHREAGRLAGLEEAAVALEADAKLCDCAAREENECACGAWCEWKTITSARAVEIVRAAKGEGNG